MNGIDVIVCSTFTGPKGDSGLQGSRGPKGFAGDAVWIKRPVPGLKRLDIGRFERKQRRERTTRSTRRGRRTWKTRISHRSILRPTVLASSNYILASWSF